MDEDSNNKMLSKSVKRTKLNHEMEDEQSDLLETDKADMEIEEKNEKQEIDNANSKNDNEPENGEETEDETTNDIETIPESEQMVNQASEESPGPSTRRHVFRNKRNYRPRVLSSSSESEGSNTEHCNEMSVDEQQDQEDDAERDNAFNSLIADVVGDISNDSSSSSFSFEARMSRSSELTSIDSYDSQDIDDNDKKDEEDDNIDKLLEKPNYKINLAREIMLREQGLIGNGRSFRSAQNSTAFQNRFYSALQTVEKMKLLHRLENHRGCVNSLNFNKSGTLLATGSDDLKVIIWDWASNKAVCSYSTGHDENVFQAKFLNLPGAISIVSSSRDGQVRFATIPPSGSTNVKSSLIFRHSHAVHKIALCPQNPHEILTAGEDANVVRVDLREQPHDKIALIRYRNHRVPLYSIAHHPLKPEFCVAGKNSFVHVFDRRNMKQPITMMSPKGVDKYITCAVYNSTGSEILASYSDENIYLFNNQCYVPGYFLHSYRGHRNCQTIKGVNFFGQNSEYIVSGSDCGNIFFWDKKTESIVNWFKGDRQGVVNCLEPHPSFPILATSGLEHDAKIWIPSNVDYPPKMTGIKKCVKKNQLVHYSPSPFFFQDRRLMIFLQQCFRNRRLPEDCPYVLELSDTSVSDFDEYDDEGDDDDDDDDDDGDGDNQDDDEDEDNGHHRLDPENTDDSDTVNNEEIEYPTMSCSPQ